MPIVAINEVERKVLLDDGQVIPVVKLYSGEGRKRKEVDDWQGATHFMAGPISGPKGPNRFLLVEIAALTIEDAGAVQ